MQVLMETRWKRSYTKLFTKKKLFTKFWKSVVMVLIFTKALNPNTSLWLLLLIQTTFLSNLITFQFPSYFFSEHLCLTVFVGACNSYFQFSLQTVVIKSGVFVISDCFILVGSLRNKILREELEWLLQPYS